MALVINGQHVDDAVLDSEFAEIKSYYERLGNVSCCERDPEFRGYARDNIIARVVLSQEAKRRLGDLPPEEVDEAMKALEAAHGGENQFYMAIGATQDQMHLVRRDVEADLRVKKMLDALCEAGGSPDESQLQAYYDAHPELFLTDERVRASHILKAPTRGENRQGAYDALRAVRQQLMSGADFDELAKLHSDKASEHIDLGFFKRGELPEEFEVVAFSMSVGEISPIFCSPYGYHVMKVTEHEPAVRKPFEDVKADVATRLLAERRNDETRNLVATLKLTATIEEPAEQVADATA